MKPGNMIMFTKTGEYAVYLGFFGDVYVFQHKDFTIRIPEESFKKENIEVIK
tara:strand:- start:119 stop:274 length:156 start_codon:yes stop_codon:yes gene_type:complete